MKLDRNKIQKNKFGLMMLCIIFCVGLLFITKITDLITEIVEMEAVVTHTYDGQYSAHSHLYTPTGSKMNIKWIDLNGEVHTEGNLANKEHLKVGDTCTISVDAKTQSRRVLSKSGCACMLTLGISFCVVSLKLLKLFYGREK